jgi:hypothetical protein
LSLGQDALGADEEISLERRRPLHMDSAAPPFEQEMTLSKEEHYRLLIEDARSLRLSRENINDLFIGLTTLLLGAQGYLLISFQQTDAASTFYIIGIALAGLFVCSIWSRVLAGYKQLLNYRYLVLKFWEDRWFSKEQQFYVSEDALYEHDPANWPKTPITQEIAKGFKRIYPFVDLYTVLPRTIRWALILVALIRPILLFISFAPALMSNISQFIR